MRRQLSAIVVLGVILGAAAQAQDPALPQAAANRLPAVRITQSVTVSGKPLAPGTYEVRITAERPTLPSGTPNDTQRWVEFLSGGTVVAREIAEVIPADSSASPTGTSSAAAPPRTLVQLLKEGDFVRVSIWESGLRFLVYLPTGNAPAPSGQPVTPPAQPLK